MLAHSSPMAHKNKAKNAIHSVNNNNEEMREPEALGQSTQLNRVYKINTPKNEGVTSNFTPSIVGSSLNSKVLRLNDQPKTSDLANPSTENDEKSPVQMITRQLAAKIDNSLLNSQNIDDILRRNQHTSTSVSVTSKNITTASYLNQNNQYITSQPIPFQNNFATLVNAQNTQKTTLDELERKLMELEKATQDSKIVFSQNIHNSGSKPLKSLDEIAKVNELQGKKGYNLSDIRVLQDIGKGSRYTKETKMQSQDSHQTNNLVGNSDKLEEKPGLSSNNLHSEGQKLTVNQTKEQKNLLSSEKTPKDSENEKMESQTKSQFEAPTNSLEFLKLNLQNLQGDRLKNISKDVTQDKEESTRTKNAEFLKEDINLFAQQSGNQIEKSELEDNPKHINDNFKKVNTGVSQEKDGSGINSKEEFKSIKEQNWEKFTDQNQKTIKNNIEESNLEREQLPSSERNKLEQLKKSSEYHREAVNLQQKARNLNDHQKISNFEDEEVLKNDVNLLSQKSSSGIQSSAFKDIPQKVQQDIEENEEVYQPKDGIDFEQEFKRIKEQSADKTANESQKISNKEQLNQESEQLSSAERNKLEEIKKSSEYQREVVTLQQKGRNLSDHQGISNVQGLVGSVEENIVDLAVESSDIRINQDKAQNLTQNVLTKIQSGPNKLPSNQGISGIQNKDFQQIPSEIEQRSNIDPTYSSQAKDFYEFYSEKASSNIDNPLKSNLQNQKTLDIQGSIKPYGESVSFSEAYSEVNEPKNQGSPGRNLKEVDGKSTAYASQVEINETGYYRNNSARLQDDLRGYHSMNPTTLNKDKSEKLPVSEGNNLRDTNAARYVFQKETQSVNSDLYDLKNKLKGANPNIKYTKDNFVNQGEKNTDKTPTAQDLFSNSNFENEETNEVFYEQTQEISRNNGQSKCNPTKALNSKDKLQKNVIKNETGEPQENDLAVYNARSNDTRKSLPARNKEKEGFAFSKTFKPEINNSPENARDAKRENKNRPDHTEDHPDENEFESRGVYVKKEKESKSNKKVTSSTDIKNKNQSKSNLVKDSQASKALQFSNTFPKRNNMDSQEEYFSNQQKIKNRNDLNNNSPEKQQIKSNKLAFEKVQGRDEEFQKTEVNEMRLSRMNEEQAANFYEQRKNDIQKNIQKISKNKSNSSKKQTKKPDNNIQSQKNIGLQVHHNQNIAVSPEEVSTTGSKLATKIEKIQPKKKDITTHQSEENNLKDSERTKVAKKSPSKEIGIKITEGAKVTMFAIKGDKEAKQERQQRISKKDESNGDKFGDAIQFARENIFQRMDNIEKALIKDDIPSSRSENTSQKVSNRETSKPRSKPSDIQTQEPKSNKSRENPINLKNKEKSPSAIETAVSLGSPQYVSNVKGQGLPNYGHSAPQGKNIKINSFFKEDSKTKEIRTQQKALEGKNKSQENKDIISKKQIEKETIIPQIFQENNDILQRKLNREIKSQTNSVSKNLEEQKTKDTKLYDNQEKIGNVKRNLNDQFIKTELRNDSPKGYSALKKSLANAAEIKISYNEVPANSRYHEKRKSLNLDNKSPILKQNLRIQEQTKLEYGLSKISEPKQKKNASVSTANQNISTEKARKDLSFSPKSVTTRKEIPNYSEMTFEERNRYWQIRKNQSLAEKERIRNLQESTDCTFQPFVPRNTAPRKLSPNEFYQKNIEWSEKIKAENTLKAEIKLEELQKPETTKSKVKPAPISPLESLKPHGLFTNKNLETIKQNLDFSDQKCNKKLKAYFEYEWNNDRLQEEIEQIEQLFKYVKSVVKTKFDPSSPTRQSTNKKYYSDSKEQQTSTYTYRHKSPFGKKVEGEDKDVTRIQSLKNLVSYQKQLSNINPEPSSMVESESSKASKNYEKNIQSIVLKPESTRLTIKNNRYVIEDNIQTSPLQKIQDNE